MLMPRDPGSLMMIILVIVAVAMIFWRTLIKLTLAGFVALAIFGLIFLLQGLR
jgi:hypothetical protein